jgi:hypothetical protein
MDRGLQFGPEVLAARMALSTLSDPAAGALRWLSWFGANRRLSPELPALRVAPFGVLPASLVGGGDIEPEASDASSPRVLRPIARVETDTTRRRSGARSEGSTTAGRRARPRTGNDDVQWLAAPAGSSDEPMFLLPSQRRLPAAETDGAADGGRPRELLDHAGSSGEPPEVTGAQQHEATSPSESSALAGLVAALWPSASERSTRISSSDVRPSRLFVGLAQPKVELVPEPVVAVGLSDVGGGLDDAFASIDVIPEERSADDHVARPPATNRPIQDGSDRERGAQRRDLDPLEGAASRQDPPWPDGSDLSELLNSVLVEQARRAGVDLS